MPTLLLLLAACGSPETPPAYCAGPTTQLWDPADPELLQFPDDALAVADPGSPTGLRPALEDHPWMAALPPVLAPFPAGLDERSGFGRLGAIFLRFDGKLGALADGDVRLVALDTGADHPFEAFVEDRGEQLRVQPLEPLRPATRYALVLSAQHVAEDGGCVAPAEGLQGALAGGGDDPWLAERYGAVAEALGVEPADLSAATVFTTHDDVAAIHAVASSLAAQTCTWAGPASCSSWRDGQRCARSFEAWDHRGALIDPDPAQRWTLDVSIYLPPGVEGPAPVAIYGHGINSSRGEAEALARRVFPLGMAVVSVDALEHGSHPTNDDDDLDAAAFLGIDLSTVSLDGRALAQNFLQTDLDRLQLLTLLQQDPDLDGDGAADIDPERIAYVGVSLGGLLGPGLVAMSDEVDLAALPVGGGHLATFASTSSFGAAFEALFVELLGDEAAWQRVLAVGQAAMDPADPAVWAAHVLDDRLGERAGGPHLLLPVSVFDEVVPPETGIALARALRLPHVEPVIEPVALLTPTGPAPVSANLDGVTAGFFQYDRVTDGEAVVASEHGNTPYGTEGELQLLTFLETWLEGGAPVIIDPYAELGTPPLE
ncbi:MAG: hypothetical protein H6739_08785 [Alphaproteobacteria bacterium]|nr:hypothetical protein [Alphaproteobacteria bacterium]